jgi:hypothetical protein
MLVYEYIDFFSSLNSDHDDDDDVYEERQRERAKIEWKFQEKWETNL